MNDNDSKKGLDSVRSGRKRVAVKEISAKSGRVSRVGAASNGAGVKRVANGGENPRRYAASKPHTRRFEPGMRNRKRRSAWPAVVCSICVLALLGVGYVAYGKYTEYQKYMQMRAEVERNVFYAGEYFEGYSLEGMTLEQATTAAAKLMSATANDTNITVKAGSSTFSISSNDVSLTTNAASLLATEYHRVHTGSLGERYQKIQTLKTNSVNLTLSRGWDESALRARVSAIADAVYKAPVNAGIASFNVSSGKGTFTFSAEENGIQLDADELYAQVSAAVAEGRLNAEITASTKTLYPQYDVAYMEDHFGLVASARTDTTSNSDRNNNIKLAAGAITGTLVKPGETFSFNAATGERTRAKGYKEAGAYSNGILVLEPGGGVCQVSSTLYNAVAKSDLTIVDRSPHSRPSSYIGIGLDAAVNWPNQDFQFENDTGFPLYITAYYADQTITVRIYGRKLENGMYIKLTSEKTETIPIPDGVRVVNDSSLPSGEIQNEDGREGSRAVSYKVYYNSSDEVINRVKLASSYYAAAQVTQRVGTGS